jgi:hypothetical protein
MATLTAKISLISASGGAFTSALNAEISHTYTVDLQNANGKIKIVATDTSQLIPGCVAATTGSTLVVIKNIDDPSLQLHNGSYAVDQVVANLGIGEVFCTTIAGSQNLQAYGTIHKYFEVYTFELATDRS